MILGVLQNQWFRDPNKVKAMIERSSQPELLRRRIIVYSLFAGCKSGRVLKGVFGDLCNRIVWEESSRELGGSSNSRFPADHDHLRKIVAELQPKIVIGFGIVACDALKQIVPELLIEAPHPAGRLDVVNKLVNIRVRLERTMKVMNL